MGDFDTLYANLAADPRMRGKQFEHVCKWFLQNDPTYRAALRRVWLWDDWEHKWGADAGIDLVAEDQDGRFWAIQAKAYDPAYSVTKADVDKFLSESSRKLISYRLVIATTDKLHRIARKTLEEQDKRASFIGLADLVTAEVDWPTSPEHLRPAKPRKPATPRDYQKEAIRDVVDGFRGADRGQLIMACGTGKTLTSLFIKEKLDAERTLVLLPSLSLLKQTLAVWHANAAQPFDFKAVCSDQTVVAADDEPVAHTAELGIPVTTDPAEIAEFLQRRSGPRVVFSTYQSSPQIEAAFTLGRIPQFDIAIADESHRVAGDESTVFATILNDCAIKAKRRLFMTATPRYYTGRVIKQARADAEMTVASMDDHTKFGEVFHRLSFGDAIRRGLLTDYQVAVIAVNDDETFSELGNRALVNRAGKTTDARTLASQIALAKALRTYNMRRVISFHSRVARAKQYAQEMPEVIDWMPRRQRPDGPLWTGYASGEMSAGERHVRLQRLRQLDDGERGLLTNARCLAEGVDVPTLDGVAFIDPRGSEVDIIQAVGRAIRLAENKTVGTIVIPVFVKTGADAETALRDSSFKAVWRIVKALRAHDEDLAEEIDSIRRSLGQGIGGTRLPAKIHLDVASSISNDFASAFDVMLVEQTSARWEFWLGLLQRYAEETGTARIPIGQVIEGYPLGQWAGAQRMAFSKGALSDERRQKLEALPGWAWNILDDQWDTWMRLMRDFAADHGHTNVPYPYMVGEYNLRNFVATQRGLYRQGKLSQERVEELEALPGWVWDVLEDNWQRNYELLKVYSDREGHACPPRTFAPDGVQVGQWIGVQRGKRVQMSPQRRALLEALPGWSWDPYNDRWRRKYAALVAFTRREGHARVPNSHREGGVHLGKWVTHQRSSRDKLTDEQRGLLEALPGWTWDARSDMWQRKYALLQQFQRREGHALVPQGHIEDGVKLGTWVLEQRNHEDTISEERRKLLESVPGWSWNPHEDSFEKGYRALRRFAAREGHSRVPAEHVEGSLALGVWVGQRRAEQNSMTAERKQRLEDLPGWSWDPVADSWMEHLEALRVYTAREGNSMVPTDHVEGGLKLGQWVRLRRKDEAKISPDRKALLEAIPGWFWGTKSDYMWNQRLDLLKQFVAREGHALVPGDHIEDGIKLGSWIREQRSERDNLPQRRIDKLESIPGWSWSVSQDAWTQKYELARQFAAREGHARIPQSHIEDGIALGSWIAVQRSARNKLTEQQRNRLEALPGWVWKAR